MPASTLSPQRFWVSIFLIVSLFLVISYQVCQLMVIRRPALLGLADKQHNLNIEIPPLRGAILDRNGKELATNLRVPSIYAVPRLIGEKEKDAAAEKLGHLLHLKPAFVRDRLARDKSFIWLKRKVTYEEADAIKKQELPYLGVLKEYRRFFPQGDLLAQIIGFSDVDNAGIEGIERYLNRDLQGRKGLRQTKRDALGREIKAFEARQIPAIHGHQVQLTIDQYIQYLTERALDRSFTAWKAKGAMAIVMEAKTGKILAIANRPTYDPNHFEKSTPESRRNRVVTDMYEPGSVFKIVAASALLNENKITPETMIHCENGAYRYGSRILHDVHSYGSLSFADILVKSSNIGTVKATSRLKPQELNNYIEAFGFGKMTGIDLPGEAPGYVRPASQWSNTSPFNIPMGQEVMVTTLQMTVAMAVVANGGELVKPYVIERVADQEGVVIREKKPVVKRRVIRPEVAEVVRGILRRVVEEGTGKKAMIDGIPVGGKTGTAQKVLPNGRGYSHSNFISSFVGFAPADNPEFVMTVVLDDPKPLYYGGTVAAPVFKEVMETLLLSMGYVPANAKPINAGGRTAAENLPKKTPMLRAGQALGTKI